MTSLEINEKWSLVKYNWSMILSVKATTHNEVIAVLVLNDPLTNE
jgi:hypothetical protein